MKTQTPTKNDLKKLSANLHDAITDSAKSIVEHVNKSHGLQNERLERMETELLQANTKLDAIMTGEVLVTRK